MLANVGVSYDCVRKVVCKPIAKSRIRVLLRTATPEIPVGCTRPVLSRVRDYVTNADEVFVQIGKNLPVSRTLVGDVPTVRGVRQRRGDKKLLQPNQRDKRLANGRRERRKERLVTALKREGEGFLLHREFIREHRGYVQQADLFTSGRFHRRGYSGTE